MELGFSFFLLMAVRVHVRSLLEFPRFSREPFHAPLYPDFLEEYVVSRSNDPGFLCRASGKFKLLSIQGLKGFGSTTIPAEGSWSFPQWRGTQHRPQNTMLLIIETTKEVHLILETPPLCNSLDVPPYTEGVFWCFSATA